MMNVKVKIYDEIKYSPMSEKVAEVEYYNIKGWDILSDPMTVEQIESETDESGIEECHEYLIIELENGEISTFRNSHVDLFRI